MQEHLPWAAYAVAMALAMVWLQLLPESFARKRVGLGRPFVDGMTWPNLVAVVSLVLWPFIAASAIQWDRREPSLLTILLITLACLVVAFVLNMALGRVMAAMFPEPRTDEDAIDQMVTLRRLDVGLTAAVPASVLLAYWTLSWPGQMVLCGERYYC